MPQQALQALRKVALLIIPSETSIQNNPRTRNSQERGLKKVIPYCTTKIVLQQMLAGHGMQDGQLFLFSATVGHFENRLIGHLIQSKF
jgi:hypothetical protein